MASRLISQFKSPRLIINSQLALKLSANARSFHLASADQGIAFISGKSQLEKLINCNKTYLI